MDYLGWVIYIFSIAYVLSRIYYDKKTNTINNDKWFWIGVPINLVFGLAPIVSLWIIEHINAPIWLLWLSVGSAVIFFIYAGFKKGPAFLATLSVMVSFSLFAFGCYSIIQRINLNPPKGEDQIFAEQAKIEHSFIKVKDSFENVEQLIKAEKGNLISSLTNLDYQLSLQKNNIKNLSEEAAKLKEEIKIYKSVASLSKDQAEVILTVMNQENWTKRVYEFIFGIIVGVLGNILTNYVVKRLKIQS